MFYPMNITKVFTYNVKISTCKVSSCDVKFSSCTVQECIYVNIVYVEMPLVLITCSH